MSRVFADTYYFLALSNPRDSGHSRARAFELSFSGQYITTGWIATELLDALVSIPWRPTALQMVDEFRTNPRVTYYPMDDQLMQQGVDLFRQRPDKEWSLTDCISFIIMQREGLTEALTGDHHFEQAGFTALLK